MYEDNENQDIVQVFEAIKNDQSDFELIISTVQTIDAYAIHTQGINLDLNQLVFIHRLLQRYDSMREETITTEIYCNAFIKPIRDYRHF